MNTNRKMFTIIFGAINLVTIITLLVVALILRNIDVLQVGYGISALVCLLLIFLRLSRVNRLLGGGRMDQRFYKQSDEYREVRYENYFSLAMITIYIILIFSLSNIF